MADVNQKEDTRREHQEPAKTKSELIARNAKEGSVTPYGVPQSTFPEQMKQGLPGMVNRMVDYNAVSRSAKGGNIPACRAVSQSLASDIGCVIGGTLVGFIGITILDPTNVPPVGTSIRRRRHAAIFQSRRAHQGRDFRHRHGGDAGRRSGALRRGGWHAHQHRRRLVRFPGARWKHARPANELNVVQLGIQR